MEADATELIVGDLGGRLLGSPKLRKGDRVQILAEDRDRYKIRWPYRSPDQPGDHEGWVSKRYVVPNSN
jgi:hypothetical protein